MARPRESIKVLQTKGKKHLTKEEIKKREKQEAAAKQQQEKPTAIKPPTGLSAGQKRVFKKAAKQLLELGLIMQVDAEALARYAIAQDAVNKLNDMQQADEALLLNVQFQKLLDAKIEQARKISNDLGLAMYSRLRMQPLTGITAEEVKAENKFNRFRKND